MAFASATAALLASAACLICSSSCLNMAGMAGRRRGRIGGDRRGRAAPKKLQRSRASSWKPALCPNSRRGLRIVKHLSGKYGFRAPGRSTLGCTIRRTRLQSAWCTCTPCKLEGLGAPVAGRPLQMLLPCFDCQSPAKH